MYEQEEITDILLYLNDEKSKKCKDMFLDSAMKHAILFQCWHQLRDGRKDLEDEGFKKAKREAAEASNLVAYFYKSSQNKKEQTL